MNPDHPYCRYRDQYLSFEKPGRYTGGEWGSIPRNQNRYFKIALCFPDLYEIGMSNQAVKILYDFWNSLPDVQCERCFTPFLDMEKWLREENLPLTSLESGIPLSDFDVVAFTVGYELSLTNIINMIELSGLSAFAHKRTESDPLVICGGPAVTNPEPFSPFMDGIFIGEAEPALSSITENWIQIKRGGGRRSDFLKDIHSSDFFWSETSGSKSTRSIWNGFSSYKTLPCYYPVPNIDVVQNHGVIEIMRGCPNKCRFCHAGYFYKPVRYKSLARIISEADYLVQICGYREITLSSLSSGDYPDLVNVIQTLNKRYSHLKISFAVPSLRVDSLTLPIIAELSAVRKSGLTFAVETTLDEWQKAINKPVPKDKILQILFEAKSKGWKLAKFYFMIGLPGQDPHKAAETISSYLLEIQKATGMQINANVNVFIPKVHTPFQYSKQLEDQEGFSAIKEIRQGISSNKRIRLSYQSTFLSTLEGILARGDAEVGMLFFEGYQAGARFDAWPDHFSKEIWEDIIARNRSKTIEILEGKGPAAWETKKGWSGISLGASVNYLAKEFKRSLSAEISDGCSPTCTDPCGICSGGITSAVIADESETEPLASHISETACQSGQPVRVIFRFGKKRNTAATALGHLDVLTVIERTYQRAGVLFKYSEGYNPIPKIQIAAPLPVGYSSVSETGSIELLYDNHEELPHFLDQLRQRLNSCAPEGLEFFQVKVSDVFWDHKRLMGEYWGSSYVLEINPEIREPNLFLNELNHAIETSHAMDHYHLEQMKNVFRLTVQEFNTPIGLQKLLKSIAKPSQHFLTGLSVERTEMYYRENGDKTPYFSHSG